MTGAEPESPAGPVWDPLVRIAHWGIAAAVLLNALVIDEDAGLHVWLGYAAFGLLGLRLVWGFTGMPAARFSAFPPSLSAARRHLGEIAGGIVTPHRSHNPLGALMAYAMWATLLVVSVTGVLLDTQPSGLASAVVPAAHASPHEDDDDREGDGGHEAVEEVHEAAANLLLLLAVLHVGGVAFETRRTGRDIVGPMLRGRSGPPR